MSALAQAMPAAGPPAPSGSPPPAAVESRKSGYLPGLDGLRGIAILGVLMTHDLPWSLQGHTNAAWKGYGGLGVQLFFAISGILICWRLCEDEARLGSLRLRAFYIRRLFRIQPASLLYLLAILGLGLAAVVPFNWHFWTGALLTYANFLVTPNTPPGPAAAVGHFWTLAVEEHFYLLLSLLFVLIAPRLRPAGFTAVLLVLFAAQRYGRHHGLYTPDLSERRTYWQIQTLLVPACLALLVRSYARVRAFVIRFLRPWVAVLLVFSWMALNLLYLHLVGARDHLLPRSPLELIATDTFQIVYGCDLLVLAVMLHRDAWSTRVLETAPLRFVGRISYSLYLWHILFFLPVLLPGQIHAPWLLFLGQRPWRYVSAFTAAVLSYYAVERPLVRLGHRLAPPATAGHRDLLPSAPPHAPAAALARP